MQLHLPTRDAREFLFAFICRISHTLFYGQFLLCYGVASLLIFISTPSSLQYLRSFQIKKKVKQRKKAIVVKRVYYTIFTSQYYKIVYMNSVIIRKKAKQKPSATTTATSNFSIKWEFIARLYGFIFYLRLYGHINFQLIVVLVPRWEIQRERVRDRVCGI